MKNSLRVLTWATLACGCAAAAYLVGEPAFQRARARAGTKAASSIGNLALVRAPNIVADPTGSRQLLLAIARLEQRGSVTARVRQQAQIGDLPFFGVGTYRQQGRGTMRHVRWLLQSQRNGLAATLLQISDGRFLWTDRHLASGRQIDRVDLWQLRRQAKRATSHSGSLQTGQASSSPFSPLLGGSFGGLPMLLESLAEHFEFASPRPFRYGEQKVIGLVGRWRQEALASILADLSRPAEASPNAESLRKGLESHLEKHPLPNRVPHHVLVLLGQHDLFPYLIDYRAASDPLADPTLSGDALYQLSHEPLARLEFYEVRFDQRINTSEFIYTPPPEPEWLDSTAAYLRRLNRLKSVRLAIDQERRMATNPDGPSR